jgi:hypothetical protein
MDQLAISCIDLRQPTHNPEDSIWQMATQGEGIELASFWFDGMTGL